ncbi:MAG: ArsR family transcriptional regulator [Thermodesulfobacteriota bacterium]
MTEVARISPQETKEKVTSGTALLVCAYASKAKFAENHLEGAISLTDFQARANHLPKEQEIIFYCA